MVLKQLAVNFKQEPRSILSTSDRSKKGGTWLQGAVLNIAECCLLPCPSLKRTDDSTAIIWRDEGLDDYPVNRMSLKELRGQVMCVCHFHTKNWSIPFFYANYFFILPFYVAMSFFQNCCTCLRCHVWEGGPDCNRHAYDMQCSHNIFGDHPWWLCCCIYSG